MPTKKPAVKKPAAKKPAAKKPAAKKPAAKKPASGSAKGADAFTPEPAQVDAFLAKLAEPQRAVLQALRETILAAAPSIGEHLKWNHPAFFFTGPMPPSDPKEYRRYLVVSNTHRKDGSVLLVFLRGDAVDDGSGFLTGDYPDGRRLASFLTVDDVRKARPQLTRVLRAQLAKLDA